MATGVWVQDGICLMRKLCLKVQGHRQMLFAGLKASDRKATSNAILDISVNNRDRSTSLLYDFHGEQHKSDCTLHEMKLVYNHIWFWGKEIPNELCIFLSMVEYINDGPGTQS